MKNNKPEIFTISTAHLDTSWIWTLEETIDKYIPDTIKTNFKLLNKYPEYKFNFEGSLRYELIKEYYPAQFETIRELVKSGRWHPCGSCYENGDVNIPSPEAMTRNILYGNGYFTEEFGVCSNDIFLPDCFGFGRALPTISAHSGLTGFSTGKLFWGSSVPIPFDTGKWTGPDGKYIWSALMPFSYTTSFGKMNKAKRVLEKLEKNKKDNLPAFTFAYHGIGDRGGSPHKSSVKNVALAQRNNDHNQTNVYSASSKEFFDKLESMSDEQKEKMPIYDSEFLLTAHGTGSYTSRTVTKRWNKRCEQLADAAERFAAAALVNGLSDYPQYGIDKAWKNVLAHHFHDDITGTSFEECYKRSHNDYVQALNTFSSEFTSACKAVSSRLDTSFDEGYAVVVANPLQTSTARKEAVRVTLNSTSEYFRVFDYSGNEMPSQSKKISDNQCEVTFIANAASCSLSVYNLRESDKPTEIKTELACTNNSIENKNLIVSIDSNGDICSVFDKRINRELISKPVRMAVLNNTHSFDWPAWEVIYDDLCGEPYMYPTNPDVSIVDNGPAICSIKIIRKAGKSTFTQIISLDSESEFVSVHNETDWREEASLLKAQFSLTAENELASYDIGIGATKRATNTKSLCEVPAQKWTDITNADESFGASIFSDSRSGWDKPDKSTLRLTLIHTPMSNYRWECSQHIMDIGINRYSFAIMGHNGKPDNATAYADAFCQPMHTFVTDKHSGTHSGEYSFVRVNNDKVRISALKKAQNSDKIIIRVAECSGEDQKNVEITFAENVISAMIARGDEVEISPFELTDGKLVFDIGHNEIKTFSLTFKEPERNVPDSLSLALECNARGITTDSDRQTSTLSGGYSLPCEMLPKSFRFAGVEYEFSDSDKNCIVCNGQTITVPEGYDTVHLLLASLDGDKHPTFKCTDSETTVYIPDCFEALGHWDLMLQKLTGYIKEKPQAFTVSHTHNKNGNITAKQFYLFDAEISLNNDRQIKLPIDKNLILFAATAVNSGYSFTASDEHFDRLSKRKFDYTFSDFAIKRMKPALPERVIEKLISRKTVIKVKTGGFYNEVALSDLYYIIRKTLDSISYKKKAEKLVSSRKK